LKMTTASAPAAWALTAFSAKVQVPRWISAMSFGPEKLRRVKSAASQPLVDDRGGVRLMSTGMTGPVTSPTPLPVNEPVSYEAPDGRQLLEHGGEDEVELELVRAHRCFRDSSG